MTVQQLFIVFSTKGTWITSTHKLSWMNSPLLYYKTKQRWKLYLANKPSNIVMKPLCSFLRFFVSLYCLSSPPLFHFSILFDSLFYMAIIVSLFDYFCSLFFQFLTLQGPYFSEIVLLNCTFHLSTFIKGK